MSEGVFGPRKLVDDLQSLEDGLKKSNVDLYITQETAVDEEQGSILVPKEEKKHAVDELVVTHVQSLVNHVDHTQVLNTNLDSKDKAVSELLKNVDLSSNVFHLDSSLSNLDKLGNEDVKGGREPKKLATSDDLNQSHKSSNFNYTSLAPLVASTSRDKSDPLVSQALYTVPRSDRREEELQQQQHSLANFSLPQSLNTVPLNLTCWEDDRFGAQHTVAMQNLLRLSMLTGDGDNNGQEQQLQWLQEQRQEQMSTNIHLLASLSLGDNDGEVASEQTNASNLSMVPGNKAPMGINAEPCFGLEHLRQRALYFKPQDEQQADRKIDGQQGARSRHLSRFYPGAEVHKTLTVRANFGQLGQAMGCFNAPHGFCLNRNDDVIVADTGNHRIQVFNKQFRLLFCFGVPGKEDGCLWQPRKVAVTKAMSLFVVCDRGNSCSRMQVFMPDGRFLRRIDIRTINIVAGLAIDKQDDIVVVDSVTPTIYFFTIKGVLLRFIDCSHYVAEPSDIAIWSHPRLCADFYYLSDFKGHCVVMLNEDGELLKRIGGQEYFSYPNGVDISGAGDVVVGDSHGNQFHVALFNNRSTFLGHFTCQTVKVSRCCGLRLTGDGLIITLAKNNHHVLVLDTIYAS